MNTKTCSKCGATKLLEQFYRDGSKPDGRAANCMECKKRWQRKNKKKLRAYALEWKAKNADYWREYHRKNPGYKRNQRLTSIYGITHEEYLAMVTAQNGKCKICQQETKLVVDHCHTSGKVRGLLCSFCNWMLGSAKDDPDTLQRGIEYLRST